MIKKTQAITVLIIFTAFFACENSEMYDIILAAESETDSLIVIDEINSEAHRDTVALPWEKSFTAEKGDIVSLTGMYLTGNHYIYPNVNLSIMENGVEKHSGVIIAQLEGNLTIEIEVGR